MNREDVIDVLSVVAAATRRTIGEADVEIWLGIIGSEKRDDALQAVRDHIRDCPGIWMEPGHIYQRCRTIARDRAAREPREVTEARQDALAAKAAEDIAALAERKGIPADVEIKFQRRGLGAKAVACPWCHAPARRPCLIPGTEDELRGVHPSREDAARKVDQ